MTVEAQEEFFANGRTSTNHRRDGWLTLVLGLVGGTFLLFIGLRSLDDLSRGSYVGTALALLSPVLGIYLLYRGTRSARRSFRDAAVPDGEVVWYRIDPAGLWVLHGDTWWNPIAWAAMTRVRVSQTLPAVIQVLHRPQGSMIDRTLRLRGGQRTRDGLLFEDRLPAWFAATRGASPHALPPPVPVREVEPNASSAPIVMLGPDPRPKRTIALIGGLVLLAAALLWNFTGNRQNDDTTDNSNVIVEDPVDGAGRQAAAGNAPVTQPAARTEASHRIMIESVSAAKGFGFSDRDGRLSGALDCTRVADGGPWNIWIKIGQFEDRTISNEGDHWQVNDQSVEKKLVLRIDGVSIVGNELSLRGFADGEVRYGADIAPDRYLADMLRTATFIELINGDRILSIAPSDALAREALNQVADACTPA